MFHQPVMKGKITEAPHHQNDTYKTDIVYNFNISSLRRTVRQAPIMQVKSSESVSKYNIFTNYIRQFKQYVLLLF